MTWIHWHRQSEVLATEAGLAARFGNDTYAEELYLRAADSEQMAITELNENQPRTLGITAISAVSLYYKGRDYRQAENLALSLIKRKEMPEFARKSLREIVQIIWTEMSMRDSGISLAPGQVLISLSGGQVVVGGAPLDLVLDKVQTIQAMFYRTLEHISMLPHRVRGGPIQSIQEACKPWIFQAPPGSYQFSIAVQENRQVDLFRDTAKPVDVAKHFLQILQAATEENPEELENVIPERDYRTTFVKLTRNLAPTGKSFDRLNIRAVGEREAVTLYPESRAIANRLLNLERAEKISAPDTTVIIRGILRALHLDKDWIEIRTGDRSFSVTGLRSTVDDEIGPMVNRNVVVRAKKEKRDRLRFIDIEIDE